MKTTMYLVCLGVVMTCVVAWALACEVFESKVVDEGLPAPDAPVKGRASYYSEGHRGRLMANGFPFNPDARTCASWSYPLGAIVRVKRLGTERAVTLVVTDRGPAPRTGCIIDLSRAAFAALAPTSYGKIDVEVSVLNWGAPR